MGKTSRTHDLSDLLKHRVLQCRPSLLDDTLHHVITQRHTHTGNLQGVRQSVVYKDTAGQGEHLCLILQPAKGSRENQPVIVTLELRTVVMWFRVPEFLS